MKLRVTAGRVFAVVAMIPIAVYGYFAFFEISAPIQYDPLGPEGWPRVLALTALLLCLSIFRESGERGATVFDGTTKQVLIAAAMLGIYASVFEWLGFAIATSLFCAGLAGLMGASWRSAIVFGVVLGIGQYVFAVHLLGLNLPAGDILIMIGGSS